MSSSLYSGSSGIALGTGLYQNVTSLWGGSSGLTSGAGGAGALTLSLNLLSGTLDPRITFSRGTNGMVTDATGKLTYAPNNLLLDSESFEASSWNKTANATVTANQATSPNGTTTADLYAGTAAGGNGLYRATAGLTANASYTFSIYAKYVSGTWFEFLYYDGATNQVRIWVNLSTGTAGSAGAAGTATITASSVTSVGDGWYRISLTGTQPGTTGYVQINSVSANGAENAAAGSAYIWGAQLEAVTYQTTPSTYNSTTPKNLLGYTQEFDNAAWTKSNAFVQTNVITYSEQFDNAAWTPGDVGVSANTTTAPTGALTADTITPNTVNLAHRIYSAGSSVTSTTASLSVYVKSNGYNKVALRESATSGAGVAFDLSNGTVLATYSSGAATASNGVITPVGNNWYRISCTITFAVATAMNLGVQFLSPSYTSGDLYVAWTPNGTSGFYVWGAQLVRGATAGNYQPTTAAAAAVQYAAPDGSLTADKLVEDTAAASHNIRFGAISIVSGTVYTSSVYVSAAGRTRFQLISFNGASDVITTFDTTTGSVVSGPGSIANVGGGWFRVSQSFTAAATVATPYAFQIFLVSTGTTTTYTGDGTSGIYIWGAQLSNSASVDPYVYNPGAAPTSAAYYGPRFDYDPVTLAAKGLLIEESRANLLTYSSDWTNAAWVKTNITVTGAATTSPDGSLNAQKLAATATASTSLNTTTVAVTATSATYSIYVKQGTGATTANVFGLRNSTSATNLVFITFNYTTGAIAYSVGSTGATATAVGNGWWRIQIAATTGITSGDALIGYVGFSGVPATAGDFLYAYGAQLEAGSFATSYIPTAASSATRNADVATMTGANFSSWYNQTQGTFVVGADTADSAANRIIIGDPALAFASYVRSNWQGAIYDIATVVGTANLVSANAAFKLATAYTSTTLAACLSGGAVATGASNGNLTRVTFVGVGSNSVNSFLNGHIRTIAYYNSRLPDTTLRSYST